MRQFDWAEMRSYWEGHATLRGAVDPDTDPDGLQNVCQPAAPQWLNRYYARGQQAIFARMLNRFDRALPPAARALDVGCGTGRWARVLAARGYETVGIDLQADLIKDNWRRHPGIEFCCVPIQDFRPVKGFDLITSVTVLQHIPYAEQAAAVQSMARLLRPGGRIVALENVGERDPHVFPNRTQQWVQLFANSGLTCAAMDRYDFNPSLHLLSRVARLTPSKRRSRDAPPPHPDHYQRRERFSLRSRLRAVVTAVALQVDRAIDPIMVRLQAPLPSGHVGFLFTKPRDSQP